MNNLLEKNIYDFKGKVLICGSCLPTMQKDRFNKIKDDYDTIVYLWLEKDHINMAITKIGGMLRTKKIKKVIFASVDKSPHCIQLHYIQDELLKMMNLDDIEIENYIAVDNELYPIDKETISLSKNLLKIKKLKEEK